MKKTDDIINKIFFKKYKILKKIGKGSFGLVYLGKAINSNDYVAVKFESKNQTDIILERESYLLYYLRGFGIPEVITFGHNSKYNILVQTLLGSSINEIFLHNHKKFSMKDCCMIGIQMLDRLEYIHSKYIIHRDVKPDNFLVGKPDTSLIYLIDFGLAKKYMSSRTGKHVKFTINKKWSGTSRFASANSLRGVVQSRRDDLESLCYVLLFIMRGNLPWDNVFGHTENEDILLIYKIKRFMKPDLLFFNLPKETVEFFKYCKNLDFEQKPDYNYLRSLLINILYNINQKNDLNFSWINKNINNNQREPNNKYLVHRRKNSPQQRIYNSLTMNKIKLTKRSESLNEFYLNDEIDKVKRDWQPIKKISPSPNKLNYLLGDEKKEKYKYIKKIPNCKKKVIIELNNKLKKNKYNENIIVKTRTETEKMKNKKKINIIRLQNSGNQFKKNIDNYGKERKPLFKMDSFYNSSIGELGDIYNKIIIKKNNSFNGRDSKRLYNFNYIPNFKDYKKIIKNTSYNFDINEDRNNHIIKNKNYSLKNKNYNISKNNKNNLFLNNYFLKNKKNELNINIIQKNNFKNSNKISSENLSFNLNNANKIFFFENIKYNHHSPEQNNKYISNIQHLKNKINCIKLNKSNLQQKKANQINLNIGKKIVSFNYNNKVMKTNYLKTEKINTKPPPKNIRIINIISPISKTSTYHKAKKKLLTLREKKFDDILDYNINMNNPKHIINNYKYIDKNNKLGLISEYYSNASLFDKYQDREIFYTSSNSNNGSNLNRNFINQLQNNIIKTRTGFLNKKNDSYNYSHLISHNSNKDIFTNSLNYMSPKSIEKFKKNNSNINRW